MASGAITPEGRASDQVAPWSRLAGVGVTPPQRSSMTTSHRRAGRHRPRSTRPQRFRTDGWSVSRGAAVVGIGDVDTLVLVAFALEAGCSCGIARGARRGAPRRGRDNRCDRCRRRGDAHRSTVAPYRGRNARGGEAVLLVVAAARQPYASIRRPSASRARRATSCSRARRHRRIDTRGGPVRHRPAKHSADPA